MIIKKYTKMKSNKYKVLIDDIEVKLYDDVIIKYQLLRKKELSEEEPCRQIAGCHYGLDTVCIVYSCSPADICGIHGQESKGKIQGHSP